MFHVKHFFYKKGGVLVLAKKKKIKKTKNQLQFEKEIKRIKRAVRRYEKIYDKKLKLDIEKPRRITKKYLEEIHNIRGKKILELAEIVEKEKTREEIAYEKLIKMIKSFEDERPKGVAYVLNLLDEFPLEVVKRKSVNIPEHVTESIQYLIWYTEYGKESASHLYNVVKYFKDEITIADIMEVMTDEE